MIRRIQLSFRKLKTFLTKLITGHRNRTHNKTTPQFQQKGMSKYLIIFFAFLSFNTFAQEQDLAKYLNAYKTSEFEESQSIIADYSFGQGVKYTMAEYSNFEGLSFNTDIPTIKVIKLLEFVS